MLFSQVALKEKVPFFVQRDFGVYIVNAFDTGLAARLLDFPGGHSLANVLSKVFNVQKDTAMSRADWSTR